ncbi:MAG: T9SS type A sorting domain-containing protein [Bacteroidetes bacterium]|nr:T9SS type A sorting domain-containing protein [Bacteroidota bacterium]
MKKTLTIMIMLTLFGMSSIFAQINLDSGLVAKYNFNGNANDSSGYGNHGLVYGATLTADRFGNPNSAYHFNGLNNYILVANSASLNPTNAITLCAWYKPESFSNDGSTGIIDKGYTSYNPPYYQYRFATPGEYSSATYDMFSFSVTSNNISNGFNTPNHFYTVGNWYFLVGTYDGTTLKFYINNVLIQSMPMSGPLNAYNTPLYIGRNSIDPTGFLKGTVDNVRIYDRALSVPEINVLYIENNCSNMPVVSYSGLNSMYTTGDSAVILTGSPAGGSFYGVGVSGNTFSPAIAGAGTHTIVYVYSIGGCSKAYCNTATVAQGQIKVPVIQSSATDIKIIPNPNNGKFNLNFTNEYSENISIQIFNMLGELVYNESKHQYKGIYNDNIDISKLSNGIYSINIKIGERKTTEKIVVSK